MSKTEVKGKTKEDVFLYAAEEGDLEGMNRVLESTPQTEHHEMIHGNFDKAFYNAAAKGHIPVLKRLIELTPDVSYRMKMMRLGFYYFYYENILDQNNLLIKLMDPIDKIRMIRHEPKFMDFIYPTILDTPKNSSILLAVIFGETVMGHRLSEKIRKEYQNDEKTSKLISTLRELRDLLEKNLSTTEIGTRYWPLAADKIIVTLLTGDNLRTIVRTVELSERLKRGDTKAKEQIAGKMVILLLTGDNLRTIAEVVESSERSKNDTKNQQTSTATTTTSDRKDDLKKEEKKDKTGKKNKPVLPARLARLATSFNMPLSGLSPEQAQIAEKTIYEFFAAASQKAVISANDKKKSDQPGVDVAKASASNANSTKKEKNNNQKS